MSQKPFEEMYAMKSSFETRNDSSGMRKPCISIMCFKQLSVELKTWPQKIHSLVGMSLKGCIYILELKTTKVYSNEPIKVNIFVDFIKKKKLFSEIQFNNIKIDVYL